MASKKLAYSFDFKLSVVQFARETSVSAAAKQFGIARSQVRDWRRSESAIHDAVNNEGTFWFPFFVIFVINHETGNGLFHGWWVGRT